MTKVLYLLLVMGQVKSKSKSSREVKKAPQQFVGVTIEPPENKAPSCKVEPIIHGFTRIQEEIPKPLPPPPREDLKFPLNSDNPVVIGQLKQGKEILLVVEGEALADSRIMYVWYTIISGKAQNILPP